MFENKRRIGFEGRYFLSIFTTIVTSILIIFSPIIIGGKYKIYMMSYQNIGFYYQYNIVKYFPIMTSIIVWFCIIISLIAINLASYQKTTIDPKKEFRKRTKRNYIGGFILFIGSISSVLGLGLMIAFRYLTRVRDGTIIKLNWTIYALLVLFLINLIISISQIKNPNYNVNLLEQKIVKNNQKNNEKINNRNNITKIVVLPLKSLGLSIFVIETLLSLIFLVTPFIKNLNWIYEGNFPLTMCCLLSFSLGVISFNELTIIKRSFNQNRKDWDKKPNSNNLIKSNILSKINSYQEDSLKIIITSIIGSFIAMGGVAIIGSLYRLFLDGYEFILWEGGIRTWDHKFYGEFFYWLLVVLGYIIWFGGLIILHILGFFLIILPGYLMGLSLRNKFKGLIAGLCETTFLSIFFFLMDIWIQHSSSSSKPPLINKFWFSGCVLILVALSGSIGGFFGGKKTERNTNLLHKIALIPVKNENSVYPIEIEFEITRKKLHLPVKLLEQGITYHLVDDIDRIIRPLDKVSVSWLSKIFMETEETIQSILTEVFDKKIVDNIAYIRQTL